MNKPNPSQAYKNQPWMNAKKPQQNCEGPSTSSQSNIIQEDPSWLLSS